MAPSETPIPSEGQGRAVLSWLTPVPDVPPRFLPPVLSWWPLQMTVSPALQLRITCVSPSGARFQHFKSSPASQPPLPSLLVPACTKIQRGSWMRSRVISGAKTQRYDRWREVEFTHRKTILWLGSGENCEHQGMQAPNARARTAQRRPRTASYPLPFPLSPLFGLPVYLQSVYLNSF